MRKSAIFPAGDTTLLKRKMVCWSGNFSFFQLIDHNSYTQFHKAADCLVAADTIATVPLIAGNVFGSIKTFFDQQPDWLFGYLTYDLKNETEPALLHENPAHGDGVKFPAAHFFCPKHIVQINNDELIITSTEDPYKIYESIQAQPALEDVDRPSVTPSLRMPTKEYLESVIQLQQHILNGDVYEINFCQEFYLENFSVDPALLFNRLNETNPAPFATFLKHGDHYLLSASPERFLKKEGRQLTSQPMKGTILRGDAAGDSMRIESLHNDPKERAENVMIVDLVRNDLARSSIAGSVKVEELFGIYSFPTVHQMISTVSSELRGDVHFMDAIKNAFPMGSMTGAPKIKAMQLIDQYEKTKRGLFSGATGYITPAGDFDFNVVIRSFLYNANSKYLSFQAGSAITYDSIPEKEYEECLLKAKALIAALQ
ncbi:MAG: anthranilate synthase component I family protein [Chitinophagales bacterium]